MRPITLICALAATLQLLTSEAAAAGGWTWPVRGPVITSYLNGADPYASGQHRGVDIGAPVGTPVVAATSGTITFAGVVGSSGLVVSERSGDGRFDLSYLHLSAASVRRGDAVAAGARVGSVGTTGRRSAAAPHLHFGVREAGDRSAYRDPLDFLAPPATGGRPGPAPAPVPVGDPVAAEPAPAPQPLQLHGHAPAGGRSHAGAHGPAPATLPRHQPLGLPHILAPGGAPAHSPRLSAPAVDPRAHRAAPGTGAQPLAVPAGPHATPAHTPPADTRRPAAASHPHHGINLGWLAACIGLVAAATTLGHPDATRRTATRGRAAATRGRAAAARGRASVMSRLRPVRAGRSA
jgi:hypothetical protein